MQKDGWQEIERRFVCYRLHLKHRYVSSSSTNGMKNEKAKMRNREEEK